MSEVVLLGFQVAKCLLGYWCGQIGYTTGSAVIDSFFNVCSVEIECSIGVEIAQVL